jgi:hypothetical protein
MVDVVERGDIAFFYRARVRSPDDVVAPPGVQRFFAVLFPEGGAPRRLRIGRKRLPTRSGQRFWACVERVGSLDRVLADQMESERYTTKTRGERYQPGAEALGRGSYAFVRHDDHIHLVYRIEHAEPVELLPEEVRIPAAASYLVLFKQRPRRRATWTTAGEPAQLDREETEIVLVSAGEEPERALGIDILGA